MNNVFYMFDGYGADGRRIYRKGGKDVLEMAANMPLKLGKESAKAVIDPLTPNIGDGGAGEMRAQEEERRARVAQATDAVNREFASFDEPYFRSISDAYLNFQNPLIKEQAATARRELPYGFASTDSSAYLQKKGELERDIAREEANLRDKAIDFSNQQRGSVAQNRSDLVSMANAGTDAGAVAQMANARAAALAKPPAFSPIADAFLKYTALEKDRALSGREPLLFNRAMFAPSAGGDSVRYIP